MFVVVCGKGGLSVSMEISYHVASQVSTIYLHLSGTIEGEHTIDIKPTETSDSTRPCANLRAKTRPAT